MSYYIEFTKKVNRNTIYSFENYIQNGGNYEQNPGMSARAGNRILCITTVVMIGIQFLMVFLGVYDTLPLVLGTQLSVILIPIIGALI